MNNGAETAAPLRLSAPPQTKALLGPQRIIWKHLLERVSAQNEESRKMSHTHLFDKHSNTKQDKLQVHDFARIYQRAGVAKASKVSEN